MAVALETVVKQLEDSAIVAAGKLENFVPPKAHPSSVEELVRELVKQNHLTKFQAQQVAAGKVKALILGAYTLLDKIGAGGMGEVFKAQHRKMKRLVAIKMLPSAMVKDAAAAARFEREVEAAAKLRHPNIVAADDAAEANGVHFLVMEYVEGKDLSALVKQDGPIPVGKAVNYVLQAARGLEFAHSQGVIHRDIKPANLLLDKTGTVKILDMGLAEFESGIDTPAQAELTGTGTVMGTVDYMAPEQALSTRHADAKADIYSLGITLYYLIAGRAAYDGETLMAKLLAHREQPIPSLQEAQTTVSKQLEAVFKKMVAKKIEDRYQSMSEVVEALEGLGFGGSSTSRMGEVASTLDLSSAERKKLLAQAKKKPLGSITDVVASEKSKNLVLKIVGGSFGTIIAPILVFYLIRHLDKQEQPANPSAPATPAATVQHVAVATNTTSSTTSQVASWRNAPWNTPAFQVWMKDVQAMPAEKQIEAVSKKLMELNPGFDGLLTNKIEKGVVKELKFRTDNVIDLSPVRALKDLKVLSCSGDSSSESSLEDLSPLAGMPLKTLFFSHTRVNELSPLSGMSLSVLHCSYSNVSNISVLKDMPLMSLYCNDTSVADLSPLQRLPLTKLSIVNTKVTPTSVAVLQKALPNCKIEWDGAADVVAGQLNHPWDTPAFQQWVKDVQALSAEKQIEAVSKKLMELNPGFDGKIFGKDGKGSPKIENGVVTELKLRSDKLADLSPVRAFMGLKTLQCSGVGTSKLSDLSPLRGMPLTNLACDATKVSDLSPLQGTKLTTLDCRYTQVSDLSSLEGLPLTYINCGSTLVSDLSPLEGMKLTYFACGATQVSDLTPLKGMPLTILWCGDTKVSDLSPLHGLPLTTLVCTDTEVSELSPLQGMSLNDIRFTLRQTTKGLDTIRQMKSLKAIRIGGTEPFTPDEFWRKYDAGEFGNPAAPAKLAYLDPAFQQWVNATQALPAEKQIEVVSKKLMELNPGFDGTVGPKSENGMLVEFTFVTNHITDISPIRALVSLKRLDCNGSGPGLGRLEDLSPLEGMRCSQLFCRNNPRLSDLSPLEGMPLRELSVYHTAISDLSPLTGMKLTELACYYTKVSSLLPLEGMPLLNLAASYTEIADLSPLEACTSLKSLTLRKTKVTAAQVAALQKALPNCEIEWDDPAKPMTPKPAASGTK